MNNDDSQQANTNHWIAALLVLAGCAVVWTMWATIWSDTFTPQAEMARVVLITPAKGSVFKNELASPRFESARSRSNSTRSTPR